EGPFRDVAHVVDNTHRKLNNDKHAAKQESLSIFRGFLPVGYVRLLKLNKVLAEKVMNFRCDHDIDGILKATRLLFRPFSFFMMVECELALPGPVPPALDTLPPDIVRIIVRQVGDSGDSVRNLRLLECNRIGVHTIPIASRYCSNYSRQFEEQCCDGLKVKEAQYFQGVCRGWNTKLLSGKFYCPALRISSRMHIFFSILPFLILFGSFCLLDAHHLLIFHLAFFAQFDYWIALKRAVRSNRLRLARMFARCSTIDEVCLQYLNMQRLDVIRSTLGDVMIKHLVLYENECDEELKDALIDMCRKNKVEQITLCIRNFKDMRLSTFLQELAGSAPRLEIYERTTCEDNIFGLSREFWEKKEMNADLGGSSAGR
ncbi:hypothetical protein PRIPAC_82870, partial [Pristionchus pacificus]|uniref:Uncharacterized protein n=1 Tax=Pristionchus pacificus TaxID=54126 RepID=A0A2A6CKB3_PRIPA